jgi:hypothetical protein
MAHGAATEVNSMPSPQTVGIQVIGPYCGPHISGASDDMDMIWLARSYLFDGYAVRINRIPAKRDNRTGRIYVSAMVAKRVQAKVREIEVAMERIQADAHGVLPPMRPTFSVNAAEFLPDAA